MALYPRCSVPPAGFTPAHAFLIRPQVSQAMYCLKAFTRFFPQPGMSVQIGRQLDSVLLHALLTEVMSTPSKSAPQMRALQILFYSYFFKCTDHMLAHMISSLYVNIKNVNSTGVGILLCVVQWHLSRAQEQAPPSTVGSPHITARNNKTPHRGPCPVLCCKFK